jgi:hypothetical protein
MRLMKGNFPPDLFVVVLGPILIALIVIGLGSVISHAEQLRGSVVGYCIVVVGIAIVVGMLLLRGHHRRH